MLLSRKSSSCSRSFLSTATDTLRSLTSKFTPLHTLGLAVRSCSHAVSRILLCHTDSADTDDHSVCTVAARYYTKRSDDLYRKCLRIAKKCAFDVMTKGYKSTEICQGFLLLCNWNQPAERFEEERTCASYSLDKSCKFS